MSPTINRKKHTANARPVGGWLTLVDGTENAWNFLWPSLERQATLQSDVDRFCADVGCGSTLVRETSRGQLTWFALTSSQAAKMRNLRQSFGEVLESRGWHFSAVSIRVQPAKHPRTAKKTESMRRIKPGLSPAQVAHWKNLLMQLEPGDLHDAVEKLITHHSQ